MLRLRLQDSIGAKFPELIRADAMTILSSALIGLTVAEAFSAAVENDAELQAQRLDAIGAGGQPVSMGFYYGGSQNVLGVTYGSKSDNPIGTLKTETRETELVRIADHTFESLFVSFIACFATGELVAQGLSKLGSVDPVPRALWSNDRILLDVRRGDLLEFSSEERLSVYASKPIFRGLMILAGSKGFEYPTAETNSEVLIRDVSQVIWPQGIPHGFPVKARNNKINDFIEAQGGDALNSKTFERYFKKA